MAKAFRFRLDALKRYREQRLLSAKKDMALVLSRISEIENNIRRCDEEAVGAIGASYDFSRGSAAVLIMGAQLLNTELRRKRQLEEEHKLAEKELEKHREWVAHLAKELKAVEKLEERQKERHKSHLAMREKRAMDAWVAETWSQKKLRSEAS